MGCQSGHKCISLDNGIGAERGKDRERSSLAQPGKQDSSRWKEGGRREIGRWEMGRVGVWV